MINDIHIKKKSKKVLLNVNELKKGFGFGRNRLEVLKGINLEMNDGELVAFGPFWMW